MKYFTNKLTPINSFVSNEGIYRGQLMTAIFKRTPYSSLIDHNCYHVIYDEKTQFYVFRLGEYKVMHSSCGSS